MTEIARFETPAAPAYTPPAYVDPTGGRLIAWADGLAAAHRIGSALCQTAFVPAAFRGKPEDAAAAILYGDEIGLTPFSQSTSSADAPACMRAPWSPCCSPTGMRCGPSKSPTPR